MNKIINWFRKIFTFNDYGYLPNGDHFQRLNNGKLIRGGYQPIHNLDKPLGPPPQGGTARTPKYE